MFRSIVLILAVSLGVSCSQCTPGCSNKDRANRENEPVSAIDIKDDPAREKGSAHDRGKSIRGGAIKQAAHPRPEAVTADKSGTVEKPRLDVPEVK